MLKLIIFSTILLFVAPAAFTQNQANDIVGKWLTESGDAHIEIYKDGNKYFGKIIKVTSTKKKAQEAVGKEVIKNLVFKDGKWINGTIFIIKKNKTGACEAELSGKTLNLKVSIGMFTRSQTWTKL